MNKTIALVLVAAVSACETTPQIYTNAQAIALCEDKARSAAGPRGEAEFGFGTEGPSAGLSLSFDESFLRGRDPNIVYTECLDQLRQNGQISEPGASI